MKVFLHFDKPICYLHRPCVEAVISDFCTNGHLSLFFSHPQDSEKTSNEEEAIANFDFLQNEGDEENVNEEDDGDDGGNADDESDDREDDMEERRVGKKVKPGSGAGLDKIFFFLAAKPK